MTRRPDPRQPTFFDVPREPEQRPASLNFDAELRAALSRAIKETPLSRAQIAARMTDLVFGDAAGEDGQVTVSMLDSWTAPSRSVWRFPLQFLPAFVAVTGAVSLLELVAEKCGCRILVGKEAVVIQLAISLAQERKWSATRAALQKACPPDVYEQLLKRAGGRL